MGENRSGLEIRTLKIHIFPSGISSKVSLNGGLHFVTEIRVQISDELLKSKRGAKWYMDMEKIV